MRFRIITNYNKEYYTTKYNSFDNMYSNVYDNMGHIITDCGKIISSDMILIIEAAPLSEKTPHERLLSMGWLLSRDNEKFKIYVNDVERLVFDKINMEYCHCTHSYGNTFTSLKLLEVIFDYMEWLK